MDVSVFHNHYNDLTSYGSASLSIVDSPALEYILISLPFANGIMGSTDGVEIAPDWKATRWMELKASYSYVTLDLEDKPTHTKTGYVSSYEGSSPHNEGTAQAHFNLPKGFEFDPTYRYVSGLPAQLIKAYGTADARLGWNFARRFELSLSGQNLLQPRHDELGSILVERSAYAQLTWKKPAN